MTRALIWTAVSTIPQTERDSLDQQETDARAHCEASGWAVAATLSVPGHSREYIQYDEAANGMEAYRALREHLRARDFDVLVCRSLDRLGRTPSLIHQVAAYCQQAGVRIHCLNLPMTGNTTADAFLLAIGSAVAGNELAEFRRRHRDGMDGRAYHGFPISPTLPFPYYRLPDPDTGKPTGPAYLDEKGKAALHEVLDMLRRGHGLAECARYLNGRQILTASENRWWTNNLARLLRIPFLAGKIIRHRSRIGHRAQGEKAHVALPADKLLVADGRHGPVFSAEEWGELQALIAPRRRGRPNRSHHGIWSGILVCDYCGHRMYVRQSDGKPSPRGEGKNGRESIGYFCGYTYMDDSPHVNHISQRRVNRQIIPFLTERLRADEANAGEDGIAPGDSSDLPAIPDFSRELADLDRRERAAYLAYETGRIDLALYDERRKELRGLREALNQRVAEIESARAEGERAHTNRLALAELLPVLPEMLESTDPRQLNHLLRTLLPPVVVRDKSIIRIG